jgi:diguanylate cyclase (GGDEF)-like protein/PAS domain S-box-containing protein
LVVDDSPVTLLILKKYLEEEYEVINAQNANDAIQKMKEHKPDLFILDIMMPGMDGFALCEMIKKREKDVFIPIIIISALEDNESKLKGLEAGADEFITKPVNQFELNMRVRTLLKIKDLYDKLNAREKLFKAVFNHINSGITLLDISGNRLEVNNKAVDLLGYSKEDMKTGTGIFSYTVDDEQEGKVFLELTSGEINEHVSEQLFSRKDGSQFWVRHSLSSINDNTGTPEMIVSMFTDITETKTAQRRLANYTALLKKLIEAIPMPMYVKDVDGVFIECNERFCKLIGLNREEIIGNKQYSFFDKEAIKKIKKAEMELLKNGGHKEFELQLKDASGKTKAFAFYKETFTTGDDIAGLICIMVDITTKNLLEEQLRKANDILREQAIRDGLTGLYNHKKSLEMLEAEIKRAKRYNNVLSVLMLDIDYFKKVNDQYGHQTGDDVLVIVSEIIQGNIRETDIAGRYGGEEFLIIFPHTNFEEAFNTAKRINKALKEHEFKEGFKLTISGGLSEWQGENAAQLIHKADKLLYKAKNGGRDRIEPAGKT